MERQAVQSRDIAIVGYDPAKQTLEVTFRQGGVYLYSEVPQDIYEALMAASSHGTYFNKIIKEKYPFEKVS